MQTTNSETQTVRKTSIILHSPLGVGGYFILTVLWTWLKHCGAYWLIDLVISYQGTREINLQRFQVWELKRKKDCKFSILATDGNDNFIASQQIPFSDFPFDIATLWLVDGCMMLPTEY